MSEDPVARELAALKQAIVARGGQDLVENLAPPIARGAEDALTHAASGPELATLLALHRCHDGQRTGASPFFEGGLGFLSCEQAGRERARLRELYLAGPRGLLDAPDAGEAFSHLLAEERTDRWWPLAALDRTYLAANLDTGRVFIVFGDAKVFTVQAARLDTFLADMRIRLEHGGLLVGDGSLELGPRAAQLRAEEAAVAALWSRARRFVEALVQEKRLLSLPWFAPATALARPIQAALDAPAALDSRARTIARILASSYGIERCDLDASEVQRRISQDEPG